MTRLMSDRQAMREEARDLFHDYWQVVTTVKTYAGILELSPTIRGDDRAVLEDLVASVRKLEQATESMRARILPIVG